MSELSIPANHSIVRLVACIIGRTMRPCSLLLVGSALLLLLLLLGLCYGLPPPMMAQMPLIVRREIDRLTDASRAAAAAAAAAAEPIDLTGCSSEPEEDMTTPELIRKTGYPAEEHFVTTEDGYVLALHRIPGSAGAKSPAVLLHHALLESSFCWVLGGKARGLAFILADEGYDVWMGNVRGNSYSKNHTTLSPSRDPAFWNFSWHEMGRYDLPAEIEYITRLKNDGSSLMYIGHSMGTTMFYVMASERPDVASKVKAMFGLAPVAFTDHVRGPFWLLGSALSRAQSLMANFEGTSEFFAQNAYFKFAAKCICNRPLLKDICRGIVFSTVGFNPEQFNTTWLPLILSHTPAGTSLKTILHFAQGIESKRFSHYDYGAERNAVIYNSEEPPEYDFSKIEVPIALFWAENDFLAQPKDVMRLYDRLPRKIDMYRIDNPNFNHLDFLWARDAPELVYSSLIRLMEKYQSSINNHSSI